MDPEVDKRCRLLRRPRYAQLIGYDKYQNIVCQKDGSLSL